MSVLLQIVQGVSEIQSLHETMTLPKVLKDGVIFIVPVLLITIWSYIIYLKKAKQFLQSEINPEFFFKEMKPYMLEVDIQGLVELCKKYDLPLTQVILKGIGKLGSPIENIHLELENEGHNVVKILEKGLSLLPILAFISSILGIIGMVLMIVLGKNIWNYEDMDLTIKYSLVIAGLGVFFGLLIQTFYYLLVKRLRKIVVKIENASITFLDIVQGTN